MNARALLQAGVVAALLGGCTLVVGELDLHCAQQSDCDALNAKYGLELSKHCSVYQCRADQRGCEKRPQDLDGDGYRAAICRDGPAGEFDCDDREDGGRDRAPHQTEQCDGKDNDCDGFIDEGLFGETDLIRQPMDDRNIIHVGQSYSARSGLLVSLTSKDGDKRGTGLWKLDGSALVRVGQLASDNAGDANCDEPRGAIHCVFEEVAIGVDNELMLGLGINATCPYGQLRIGIDRALATSREGTLATNEDGSSTATLLGRTFSWNREIVGSGASAAARNLIVGVDRDSESSFGCPASGDLPGASSPSLALLPGTDGTGQGLAVWRAGAAGVPSPLVGLGLWVRKGLIVDATNGGHAEALDGDEALGSAQASVRPWVGAKHRGYFLAYDANARIQLVYVPALDSTSQSLTMAIKTPIPTEQGDPSHAALAVSTQDDLSDVPRGLAVAWRLTEGERTVIRFSEISFDPEAARAPFTVDEPITLSDSTRNIVEGPVMGYVRSGFSSPEPTATEQDGGWFVAWLEQDGAERRLVGVRIAELSGQKIEDPFQLFSGTLIEHLFAYSGARTDPAAGDVAGYGFVTKESAATGEQLEALNIGALLCRNP